MKIILGIDPGYDRMGVCLIEKKSNIDYKIVFSSCLKTDKNLEINKRIFEIGKELKNIILKYNPTELAIEKLFFTTNQKTVMGVSEARGAVIYLAQDLGLTVSEYTPLQIKIAITGYGKADKNQVYFMIKQIFKLEKSNEKKLDDEFDAIAVGYTHLISTK
jgi:crossover junction endodeoxyribonuclease RuvC